METEFTGVKDQLNNIARTADTSPEGAKCLQSLFITDPSNDRDALTTFKGDVLSGTCDWITQKKAFIEWYGTENGRLWISGGPGMGKTMLSIYLTKYLEHDLNCVEDRPTDLLTYFFCDFKDDRRNNAVSIVRGLLLQLLQQSEQLIDHILHVYRIQKDKLFDKTSFEALWKIFVSMVNDDRTGRVSCIIDGLDECHTESLKPLLSKLRQAQLATSKLRVIVVSREHPGCLQDSLGQPDVARIRLDPDAKTEINAGLDQYISTRVAELAEIRHYSSELMNYVKETMRERSNGTYLWVTFVVEDLRGVYASDVEAKLHDFPSGLDALYERMLQQIEPSQQKLVKQVLRWCTFALRPLGVNELVAALGVEPTEFLNQAEVLREKLKYCGHFLNASDEGVTLVHQSAYDFLTSQHRVSKGTTSWFSMPDIEAEQATLASECLVYLQNGCLYGEHLVKLRDHLENFADRLDNAQSVWENAVLLGRLGFTLALYAIRYWPDHFRLSGQHGADILGDHPSFFSKTSPVLGVWVKLRHYNLKHRGHVDLQSFGGLQHVAAKFGLDALMEQTLETERGSSWRRLKSILRKPPRDIYDDSTPLHRAVQSDHIKVAQMLIERKAPINAKDANGWSPLHTAAGAGRLPMVTMLVQHQADINIEDDDYRTPLHIATLEGHSQVVEYLLKSGASVNGSKRAASTPLHGAAGLRSWAGGDATSVELVKTLLEGKADPRHINQDGRTVLSEAAGWGNVSVMHLLLDKKWSLDVNVNQRDRWGFTALHNAVSYGELEATQLLLNQPGIDLYLCSDRPYWWPELDPRTKPCGLLDLVLALGEENVVRWLVEEVRMPLPEPSPNTPFGAIHIVFFGRYASIEEQKNVIEKLRYLVNELHIDPHQPSWGPDYQTPLSLALSSGQEEAVQFLLGECNLDPGERCSGDGGTPLHVAVKRLWSATSLITLVDKEGINVNALDNRQRTALHYLLGGQYLLGGTPQSADIIPWDAVQILLKAGAQISLKDSEGCTARDLIREKPILLMSGDPRDYHQEPRDAVQKRFDELVESLSNS